MIKLSAAIITYNEEKNIQRCLESLQDIADEIVVVDSYSTDKTRSICEEFGVRFIEHPFQGHIEQKNYALDQCQYEYVLSLDGDEALSEELKKSILAVKNDWQGEGYFFNRLTNYAGHWVRHCGWYPDQKLRLVKRDLARWKGVNPHDILTLDSGQQGKWIAGDLLHYSYDSVTDHINQTNRFTTISAQAYYKLGKRSGLLKILTRPLLKFLRDYFFKKGFLDGHYGLVICSINGLSAFLKYTKIYELEKNKDI
jgi:glycosyltransferase involved in cell wall biosynthesis